MVKLAVEIVGDGLVARQLSGLSAPNETVERSASKRAHTRDRGTPDGCHLRNRFPQNTADQCWQRTSIYYLTRIVSILFLRG